MIPLIIEILIAIFHIPPFVDYNRIDDSNMKYCLRILTVLGFVKIYFVIEVATSASPINSQKGKFIGYF